MDAEIELVIFVLGLFGLVGVAASISLMKTTGRILNFRSIAILAYVVIENVSGIVHLLDFEPFDRGYYNLLSPPDGAGPQLLIPLIGTSVGLVALIWGLLGGRHAAKLPNSRILTGRDRKYLVVVGVILLPLTVRATLKITAYVHTLSATRIIELTQGEARTGYFAEWAVWGVSFLALWLATTRLFQMPGLRMLLTIASLLGIVEVLRWTGGRSILLVLSAPLLLALLPQERRYRLLLAGVLIIGGLAYIVLITHHRTAHYTMQSFTLVDALDWQLGRFSMMGFAETYVQQHGFLFGQTFLAGMLTVPSGVLHLLGIPGLLPSPPLVTQLTGAAIVRDPTAQYIVPGLTAELYMNWGIPGIAVGYFVLGRVIRSCDYRAACTRNLLQYFAFCYAGALLVFATIPLQAGAVYDEATFVGLPVLVALVWARHERSSVEQGTRGSEARIRELLRSPTPVSTSSFAATQSN